MKRNDDIKDYLRGNRKGESANRLEREALSDPFLYEALEGLTSTPGDPIDGLIRLERHLEERVRGSKKKSRNWLYIAASFLVLAMCGTLWLVEREDTSKVLEKEMAMVAPQEMRREAIEVFSADSSHGVEDSAHVSMLRKVQPEQAEVAMEVMKKERGVSMNTVEGIVTDEKGEILPGVTILVSGTSVGTVTDEQGTFRLELPEGKTHLTFNFIGMKMQGVVVKAGTQIQVKMEVDQQKLDEVVVTGYNTVKKTSMVGAVATVGGNELKKDTIVSADDIVRFNRYMADALKYPEKDVKNGNEGIILVSFELNKKKVPSRIRIKDGFSKESNKELIRLLAESPKWESSLSGERIYVSVRFTIGKDGAKHTAILATEKPWK